jgi:uncharacterized membrane protein
VTGALRNRAWVAVGVALSAAFALLAHAAIVDGVPPTVGAALSLVPMTFLLVLLVRRAPHRGLAAVAVAVAVGVIGLVLGWRELERHFTDLLFIEHAGMNLLLGILFGRTLVAGQEPLCTRFARIAHGSLTPRGERYSRGVTVAWTLFFAGMFTTSCVLYLTDQRAAWSMLANFLTPALVAAMFVVEYAVRLRMLPEQPPIGILGGVRVFTRHMGRAHVESPR